MAFTLNRKDGKPYYGKVDHNGADNQLNKDEAEAVGIDNNTFEQNDVNNTGKLDTEETANALTDVVSESEENRLLGDANSFTDNQPTFRNPTEPLFNTQKPTSQVHTKVDPNNPDSVSLGEEERLLGFEYTLQQLKEEEKKRKELDLAKWHGSSPLHPIKGSSVSSTPLPSDSSSLQWDTTKQNLNHTLHGLKALDPLTSISGSSSSKLPTLSDTEVLGRGGHILDTPETGTSTSSNGSSTTSKAPGITPNGKVGNASAFFKGVMSGQYRHKGMPNIHAKSPKTSNAVKKLNLTSAKENIFERCVQLIQKNYKTWPSKDGERVFEKGLIAIYVKGSDEIKIKYGSYREVLFETFAKAHPELLKNIYSVLS